MKKLFKIFIISTVSVILLFTAAFFIYVSDYYNADDQAISVIANTSSNNKITKDHNLTIFHAKKDEASALIFYPGGKVDAAAYYPLLQKISAKGITCVLVKMPFKLAVLDASAADKVYKKLPDIKNWYIGGHSLGGAMASSYMSNNQDKLNGLILLGSYIYGDVSADKALTIYGSDDKVLNRSKINYNKNIIVIKGGNHAQFGNYGEQKGDGTAEISREKQQEITAAAIADFIKKKSAE